MGSRTWIKVYCDKWLEGTLRQESLELRGVWIGLLTLAGSGRYGDTGEVKLASNMGMSDGQIAAILSVDEEAWKRAKEQLIHSERISVTDGNVIHVSNWNRYQSEYERTKQYRSRSTTKSTDESTAKSTDESHKEKENRRRKRKRIERDDIEPPISPLQGDVEQRQQLYSNRESGDTLSTTPSPSSPPGPSLDTLTANHEWLRVLQGFKPFSVDGAWVQDVEADYGDLDMLDCAKEFVDYWSERRPGIVSMKATWRNRLKQVRQRQARQPQSDDPRPFEEREWFVR